MAIPRMLNCNTPFVIVTGESELSFLSKEEEKREEEDQRDSLVQVIGPHLSRVMQHGTAKQVETTRGGPRVSIVAQAESEDVQEFSPSNTQSPFSRPQLVQKCRSLGPGAALLSDSEDSLSSSSVLPHLRLLRRQGRRSRSRRTEEEQGGQRPIIRGLWVQEIDWIRSTDRETPSSVDIIPPPPQFTDPTPCTPAEEEEEEEKGEEEEEEESSSSDLHGVSDCSLDSPQTHQGDSDSSCVLQTTSRSTFDLLHVSGFDTSTQDQDQDQDQSRSWRCVRDLLENSGHTARPVMGGGETASEAALDNLRGRVSQIPKDLVSGGLRGPVKRILNGWRTSSPIHEGLLFHHLQPGARGYKEGENYGVLHHIQNGSYGDVFCVQDRVTGFKCAAKKVPVGRFSGEEVSTWSTLTSARVVELFGAVREGPNVVLFMDLKPGCLGQLLKEARGLPEDLALHYLHQTLGALQHLHRRKVLHLDVKADNVLLSADCRLAFLCDFGLAETLDDGDCGDHGDGGGGGVAFRGAALPGTETHMAPEVARGDRLDAKADVWSSCCMLLHMLNGCQPWTRYYSPPLCLQIVKEPPPLWEVPSNCHNFTAAAFRAGLQKDPERRASAQELRRKTTKALRAVGGLSLWSIRTACETLRRVRTQNQDAPSSLAPATPNKPSGPTMSWVSPWRKTAVDEDLDQDLEAEDPPGRSDSEPKSLRDDRSSEDWQRGSDSEEDIYMGEEEWLKAEREYEGDWEEEEEEEKGDEEEVQEEEECDSLESSEHLRALRGLFPVLQRGPLMDESWGSEEELEYLRDGVVSGAVIRTPSPEPRDDPPSCFSCSDTSQVDASEDDSDWSSDDLSSGVFSSCNSQTDARLEWTASSNQPSSLCFEGVDVWIENVQGECLRIRECRRVKVGHVAIGISDQVSGKTFTLETLDRKTVSFEQEIKESGLWLRCVPAPDRCRRWRWRVRDGKLELRE